MSNKKKSTSKGRAGDGFVPVPVEPFSEAYEINRSGRVRTIKTGKVLAHGRPNSNSPFVVLAHKQADRGRHAYTVSKLVALAFPPDAEKKPKSPKIDRAERDRQIIEMAAQGIATKDIAMQLGISTDTVRKVRKSIEK